MIHSHHFLLKIVLALSLLGYFPLHTQGQEDREMTAGDVFRMVEDQGFYCEITRGSGFHGEGLKGMPIPQDFIFKGKRVVTTTAGEKGLLETKSVHQEKNKEEIILGWPLQVKNRCAFQTIEAHIKILNQNNTDKNKKWRLPTIMELLSIVQKNTNNHFPKEFKLPENQTLTFWTSTPLKKEGTFLEYDKQNKAYFVVQSSYDKNSSYSLSFGFHNIEGENMENAFLLPVFSDNVYSYRSAILPKATSPTPTTTGEGKVPGFDDNTASPNDAGKKTAPGTTQPNPPASIDRIPGFDDTPVDKPAVIAPVNNPTAIKISLFPYLVAGTADDSRKKLLDYINGLVKQDIDALEAELKLRFNRQLIVDKMDPFDINEMDKISALHFIAADENLPEWEKISQVKNQVMIPLGIDIIMTVKYSLDNSSGIENLGPMVIDSLHNRIYEQVVIQNVKEHRYETLRKQLKDMVKKILFNDIRE